MSEMVGNINHKCQTDCSYIKELFPQELVFYFSLNQEQLVSRRKQARHKLFVLIKKSINILERFTFLKYF